MQKHLNELQQYSLTRSLIYLIFGLIILFFPLGIRNLIFYLISGYLGFFGVMHLFSAYKNQQKTGSILGFELITGGMLVLLAVINITFMNGISRFIPVILGVLLILTALIKLSFGASIKEVNSKYRLSIILYSLLILITGLILIFNPFGTETAILRIFGTTLVIMGIMDLLDHFTKNKWLV